MSEDTPKIQVDSDWKAEAQREKERLSTQAAEPTESQGTRPSGGPREMPPASFETLMAMLATQALLYTGGIADPQTGQPMVHLDLARHNIDLLSVLEEKTKGNLTEEESQTLATTLYELRNRYVQVANASRAK